MRCRREGDLFSAVEYNASEVAVNETWLAVIKAELQARVHVIREDRSKLDEVTNRRLSSSVIVCSSQVRAGDRAGPQYLLRCELHFSSELAGFGNSGISLAVLQHHQWHPAMRSQLPVQVVPTGMATLQPHWVHPLHQRRRRRPPLEPILGQQLD